MPTIVAVTDLGPNNRGQISASDLTQELKEQLAQDVASPEYRKKPTNCFRCVDGRLPEGGLVKDPESADPQGAGGESVFQTAIDFMMPDGTSKPLSARVAENTKYAISRNRQVKIHGDTHKRKGGCGANVQLRNTLHANAENMDIVAPKAWAFMEATGLDSFLEQDDVTQTIVHGKTSADNDSLWDATPEQVVDIAVENGATYEELIEEHREKLIVADISEYAFDEEAFMRDHPDPNDPSKSLEAFIASIGVYKRMAFEDAAARGQTERDAALRVLGFVLFNIGVPKELTAEEQGNGEALPVVILK